jgi:hypothetical protein
VNPHLVQALGLIFVLGALAFAGIFGGRAERAGAAIFAGSTLITWGAQVTPGLPQEVAFITIDLAVAIAFGLLLMRTRLTWVGAACCAQLLVLAFTATRFVNFPLSEAAYIAMLQLSAIVVCAAMAFGAWERRWGRKNEELELAA